MRIVVRDNGSLKLEIGEGESFELVDAQGNAFGLGGRQVISLCRCGHSADKPFCDASHRDCGFDSVVVGLELRVVAFASDDPEWSRRRRLTMAEVAGRIVDRARKAELLTEFAAKENIPLSQTVAVVAAAYCG